MCHINHVLYRICVRNRTQAIAVTLGIVQSLAVLTREGGVAQRGWQGMPDDNRERVRYYITKAIEAEESAARARNPDVRQKFLDIAKSWRELAEQTQRRER